MANRSDFGSIFPRQIKRMLASMSIREPGIDSREQRLLWIGAHKNARNFRQKMNSSPAGRNDSLPDAAE